MIPASARITQRCRLLALPAQESYYDQILDRCLKYWSSHIVFNDLDDAFASLILGDKGASSGLAVDNHQSKEYRCFSLLVQSGFHRLETIIVQAMRKLREAIVAAHRSDLFAQNAYVFMIRTTILVRHPESYHPAILHLLNRMHPAMPLAAPVFHEISSYHILDLACRQRDINAALLAKLELSVQESKINQILSAITRGDWVAFWKIEKSMDAYQTQLVSEASNRMRRHAVESLGKAYLSADVHYLERTTQMTWGDIQDVYNVQWSLVGNTVTIRQVKRK